MEEDRIQGVYRKIEREKALITAARAMRGSTENASVQQRCDANIRDSQRNISYLEGMMKELQTRQLQTTTDGMGGMSMHDSGPPPPPKGGEPDSYGSGMGTPRAPFAQQAGPMISKKAPNYSRLDLIKYDTPHLGPRITLMLSQLAFKLSVEKQYKEGIEKMARLYQMEGDRKAKADADAKRIESNQKIQLLKQALKRYEDLHVDMDSDVQADDDSINTPNQRRPLTGRLEVKVIAVRDVDHATTSRFTRGPETFVIVKVEDVLRAKTKATRTDKWTDESHDIDVDKANEVEITLYDQPSSQPLPIGMLWIRISDIVEELRRKKIEQDMGAAGWVSADNMEASTPGGYGGYSGGGGSYGGGAGTRASTGMGDNGGGPMSGKPTAIPHNDSKPMNIDAWFVLEPVGQIHLELGFVKYNKGANRLDLGLGRKGAVRKQKEEVHEMYGHKFVQQQFYNIMRCAYCGDFLKYSAGYQCADCKYTCHKKCYQGVVTKCIAKSNAESDPDEEKLNHRIPHRFVATTNLGASWCCHCGYMLPVGKKNARKCTECQLTCHAQCAHLVPDFCGMSMEKANEILKQIKDSKRKQGSTSSPMAARTLRPAGNQANRTSSASNATSETMSYGDSRRASFVPEVYSPASSVSSTAPPTRESISYMPTPTATPVSTTPSVDPKSAALAVYNPTAYVPPPPPGPPPQTRPQPANTASSSSISAAAAAAAAIASSGGTKRPQSVQANSSYRTPQPPYSPSQQDNDPYNQRPYGGTSPTATTHVSSFSDNQMPSQHSRPTSSAYVPPPPPPPVRSSTQQSFTPITTTPAVTQPAPLKQSPFAQQANAPVVPLASKNPPSQKKIGLDHFNFLAVLGKGNFGKVMLAETKASKKLYAIKVLKKEFIIENDEVESTRSEKRVFLIANKERHPFLLSLHACFQTETRVYFVMEYISGGDLMLHIQRGQFGTKRAQFYAAEVCLALKYFHENGVIYRDLKLDNIMLTLDGHIKVADYGLCKEEMWYGSTTSTFCGTPEFMAPEILLDKRYGRAVDWWAFGVLIYQMLLQQSPFRGDDEDEIYDAILSDEPLYPIHMPRDSVSILQKLLTREPELRLGSGPTDAQEIMSHAFFRNVNWDDIYNKRVPSPFQPQISSATDTSNFDSEFTSVTPVLTPVQSVLTQAMQEEFRGFSYTADFV